jgi:hypothetical protein
MGLDAFKSDSDSSGDGEEEQDTLEVTEYKAENTKQVTLGGDDTIDWREKYGRTRFALLRDYEWVAEKVKSGWGIESFKEELEVYPSVTIDMLKRVVQAGHLEYDDIPEYNGRSYNEKPLSWYVRMAVENEQFTRVPDDNAWKTGTPTDVDQPITRYLPKRYVDAVVPDSEVPEPRNQEEQNSDDSPAGLESFID